MSVKRGALAKNLFGKIKNAQLAEALQLDKKKKKKRPQTGKDASSEAALSEDESSSRGRLSKGQESSSWKAVSGKDHEGESGEEGESVEVPSSKKTWQEVRPSSGLRSLKEEAAQLASENKNFSKVENKILKKLQSEESSTGENISIGKDDAPDQKSKKLEEKAVPQEAKASHKDVLRNGLGPVNMEEYRQRTGVHPRSNSTRQETFSSGSSNKSDKGGTWRESRSRQFSKDRFQRDDSHGGSDGSSWSGRTQNAASADQRSLSPSSGGRSSYPRTSSGSSERWNSSSEGRYGSSERWNSSSEGRYGSSDRGRGAPEKRRTSSYEQPRSHGRSSQSALRSPPQRRTDGGVRSPQSLSRERGAGAYPARASGGRGDFSRNQFRDNDSRGARGGGSSRPSAHRGVGSPPHRGGGGGAPRMPHRGPPMPVEINPKVLANRGAPGKGSVRKIAATKDFRETKANKKLQGNEESSFDSRDRMGLRVGDDDHWRSGKKSKPRKGPVGEDLTIRPKELSVRVPITIKDLAAEMKLKASQLIAKLFMNGLVLTINDYVEDETALALLGEEFGCSITVNTTEAERINVTSKSVREEIEEADQDKLVLRSPVIAFMGHVDHGKTSLIDVIRNSNRVAGEAGAITQHIGAFRASSKFGDITILDTPGHEAFSAMRSRGADVTDLIVLVIAGDEGIREQTVEAIEQAQGAGVPIIVAVNKSDKPGYNLDNVYRELAEKNLLPEAWGGGTICVSCSSVTKDGVDDLLEMLALQAEVLELRADPSSRARGRVIESAMHSGMGAVATVLVQNGTLRLGDPLVFDLDWARVKTMHDEHGQALEEATPSTPVKITGMSGVPDAGSEFIVVESEKEARVIAKARAEQHRSQQHQKRHKNMEGLLEDTAEKEKKVFGVILRADVQGSLEALQHSLERIHSKKIVLHVISAEIGRITESDVKLAAASRAEIIGFHTQVEGYAATLISEKNVAVHLYQIIYHAVDDVKERMRQSLEKIPKEEDQGEAEVKMLFKSSNLGVIAGCQVKSGFLRRNQKARILRGGEVVWRGSIVSLKRMKEDVKEVTKSFECGVLLSDTTVPQEGDIIQGYEVQFLEQEL